jgi:hypothetical protein
MRSNDKLGKLYLRRASSPKEIWMCYEVFISGTGKPAMKMQLTSPIPPHRGAGYTGKMCIFENLCKRMFQEI